MTISPVRLAWLSLLITCIAAQAQVPQLINYQGRLVVGTTNFDGNGQFKFALVNSSGSVTYWSNNNTSVNGSEPTAAVPLTVSKGLYSVLLGSAPMVAIPPTVFSNHQDVRLRVWFSDGVNGFQRLEPDQRIAAVGYAMLAATVPDLAITEDKLAHGAVSSSKIEGGAVGSNQLAENAVGPGHIALNAINSGHIAQSTIQSADFAPGAVDTAALRPNAVTLDRLGTTAVPRLLRSLHNPSPANADNFGRAVAAVGTDKVLVGVPQDDTNGSNSGAAYLFDLNGNLLRTFLDPSPTAAGNNFGSDVAAVGVDKILVSARTADVSSVSVGAVYLFDVNNGSLLRTFNNPTPQSGDDFGISIATVGTDKVLVGASNDSSSVPSQSGSAYLFDLNNGTLLRTFANPSPGAGDVFGLDVAAVGADKVLIGAPGDDTGAASAGSAYLLALDGTLLRTFNNPQPSADELFGFSVAALGTTNVIIGAPRDDAAVLDTGSAYLYDLDGNLVRTFDNPAPHSGDDFGGRVGAVGTTLVLVSARLDVPTGGRVYSFQTNGTLHRTFDHPAEAAGGFGSAIAAVGTDKIAIGAELDDAGGSDAGTAYVFSAVETTTQVAGLTAESVGIGAVTTEGLSYAAVTGDKIAANAIDNDNIADGAITATKLESAFGADLARLSGSQTFAGANSFTSASNSFTGSGAGLTSLNAGNLTTGTLPDARLSSNVALRSAANNFSNTGNSFTGNGAGLTALNAANVSTGVLADARLGPNVALRSGGNAFTGTQTLTSGDLGVGTASPGERLEVSGSNATVRIRNSHDAIGGWIGNSWGALQLGLYNPSANTVGVVPANTKRSFFGVDGTTGQVGSLTNNFSQPQFRVELDDGDGNFRINGGGHLHLTERPLTNPQSGGRIFFPNVAGQFINVGTSGFGQQGAGGVGGPGAGIYQRTSSDFFWYTGGSHVGTGGDPGSGGTFLMNLDTTGLGIGRYPAANRLEVEGNASKSSAGSWLANSDARIKMDIRPVTGALDILARVRPVRFRYSQDYLAAHPAIDDRDYLNVTAQEFREVFPEWVKDSGEKLPDGESILQVDTYPLTIFSVSAIQELRAENERLQQANASLTQRLERLEKAIESLGSRSERR